LPVTAQESPQPQLSPHVAPVVGRTPYDALSELFSLLGRALPWVTVLALFLYTSIEIGRSYQAAQSAAAADFAQRVEALNKLLQSNFAELEKLRSSQLEGLGNFSKLNTTVIEEVVKNQTVLGKAREDVAKEREKQDAAAAELRNSQRDLEDAQREQRSLQAQMEEFQRKVWAVESMIDSANRLTAFIADRNNRINRPVSLDRNALSRRFENSSPDAVARDSQGTLYYGLYRIPGGQMGGFLRNLSARFPQFAMRLEGAGGAAAAKEGQENFRFEWVSLSRDRDFIAAQDTFIEETSYQPFVERMKRQLQPASDGRPVFDAATRSKTLQAVLWSVAVQHGPATPLLIRACDGIEVSAAADEALVAAIYKERRLTERYFPTESAQTKTLLAARYVLEEELASTMLQQERGAR
jgi:hypothetical protein